MDQKREIRYFAAVHFLMTSMNSYWSYCTNYFRDMGFSSTEIGTINAAGTFFAMLLLPVVGLISDKTRSPRKVMFALITIILPASLVLALCGWLNYPAYGLFLVLSVIIIGARQSANSTMDAWAGAELERMHVSFGSIRRFGSFGYICVSMIGVALFGPVLPTWTCLMFSVVTGIPMLLLVGGRSGDAYSRPVEAKEKTEKLSVLLKQLFCNYYFVTYMFLVMAFDLFLGVVNLDMSYLMDYVGAPTSSIGLVGSVRAATEIVVMIIMSRQKKLPPYWMMLVASGVLIALEHLLYPAASSVLHLCLITMFCSGLSGGMFYGIGANYVFKVVDSRVGSTAMAVLGVAKSLVGVIGSGLGGTIIDKFGVTTLTTGVGILALILTGLFFVSCVYGRFIRKKPYVSEQETA